MTADLALATRIAAFLGYTRAHGYHGTQREGRQPYWLNTLGQPITSNRLFELAGFGD